MKHFHFYYLCILASCIDFGSSGSGIVREWKKASGHYQHSFVGPLSMSKGCDKAISVTPPDYDPNEGVEQLELIYRGISINRMWKN